MYLLSVHKKSILCVLYSAEEKQKTDLTVYTSVHENQWKLNAVISSVSVVVTSSWSISMNLRISPIFFSSAERMGSASAAGFIHLDARSLLSAGCRLVRLFNSEFWMSAWMLRGSVFKGPDDDELLRSIARVVRDEGMSAIIVEQNPRMILPITQHAIVLDRGLVVHRGLSEQLLGDRATLDRFLAVSHG